MLQLRTGMNGRQFLALLNYKPIQFFQFSAETTATLALQKQQAQQFWPTPTKKPKEVFEPVGNETVNVVPTTFAQRIYASRNTRRSIHVNYQMGKSGNKFLRISTSIDGTINNFANILVPEDIFNFVRAMDEVLEAVHANREIIEASPTRQEKLILHTAKARGAIYDFQLELYVFNNFMEVKMRTMPNESTRQKHKPRHEFFPLHQFHWLRHTIGQLFAANGEENVQQQFGEPPDYPAWLNRESIPFTVSPDKQQQKQPIAAQPPQSQSQMASQQQQAMLQQLLQLVLQQQQQLQQMQAANTVRNNSLGFGGVVPQSLGLPTLMSDLLAQQQQQQAFTPVAPTMHNNQLDQTALANLLAQFQQPTVLTTKNNNQLMNLVNLLLQNNSSRQN